MPSWSRWADHAAWSAKIFGSHPSSSDHRAGEMTLAHIGQGLGIDDIVLVAGAQQLQEILAALGKRRCEEGETIIADLGGDAILGAMPCPCVVDRDPGRAFQGGAQHGMGFIRKGGDVAGQKPQHLTFRDDQAQASQERRDPVGRHLPLVMLEQNEANQLGTEVAAQAGRQRRHNQLPFRCHPAFSTIADHAPFDPQILDHEVVIPFEP